MPRTRRAAAPQTDMPETQPQEGKDSAAETPAATPDTPKTTRRRRTVKPETADPIAMVAENPTVEPQIIETPISETPAPTRGRGGRRRKTEEATAETPAVQTEAAAVPASKPAAEQQQAPRRRGRTRSTETAAENAVEVVVEAAVVSEAAAEGTPTEEAAPQRRRGRVRTAMPISPIEVEAPVLETAEEATAEDETATPARRRRTRRRRGTEESAPAEAKTETADKIAPETADADEAVEPVDEDSRRSRRGRRGRRRRDGSVEVIPDGTLLETGDALEDGLIVPEAEETAEILEDEDDTLLSYPPPAPPVYVAPPLVPPVMMLPEGATLPRLTATVQHRTRGLAQIVVNDAPYAPYFFFVNAETADSGEVVDSQIHLAAQAGVHLFSGVMYLPLKNAYGNRSFGAIDSLVQQVLTADPNGYLLPRLQLVPTNYWVRTHPDEMTRYADGSEGDVSLAATEFWADCVDALDALIAHFADPATPGGDRVIGFHLDRGEWFYDAASGYDYSVPNATAFQNWLHAKYQTQYALRAAWYDGSVTFETAAIPPWPGPATLVKKGEPPLLATAREGRWTDYALFASEIIAQIITGLADAIKKLSDGRLLVAVSYGYTLEFATRNDSGHLALSHVLRSPHIDILAGPNSYSGRGAGSAGAFGAPIDSVALHGKLWLVEDDTKTFLAETETNDTYNPKITSGADTQAAHERHFGSALAHKAGVTWMDLWGQGWLNSPDIWSALGTLTQEAARWEQIAPASGPTAPDVAVLIDEASLAYIKNDAAGLGASLIGRTRDLLLRSGASIGFYLQSDVTAENFPDSTLYLFLNALRVTTAERIAIRERLQRPGKTLAWLYAPGLFDEKGPAAEEGSEIVGMALRLQPWNSRVGSQTVGVRHPITERLRGASGSAPKRIGQEEILNPSYAVSDPQATVLAEYLSTGAPSLAVRAHESGWKSVFFGDPHLTIELLRGLYAYAGVPVYETQDDTIYASGDGTLLVHAASFTGQRTFHLPRPAAVYDVLENRIIANEARTFRAFLRARTTRLFFWGDPADVQAATGLPLPAPQAQPAEHSLPSPPPLPARTPVSADGEDQSVSITAAAALENEQAADTLADVMAIELSSVEIEQETIEGAEGEGSEAGGSESAASARRSRWQRRRAATRARREAERQAAPRSSVSADGIPEHGEAANPPLDIASILPDLPPRRKTAKTPDSLPEAASDDAE